MDTRINEWTKIKFVDPTIILPQLRKIQQLATESNLPDKVKNLRTPILKQYREGWEAALFCYGMGKLMNKTIYVCPYEASDYDAVSMWVDGDTQHFAPIQIKGVVPQALNPKTDINQEIEKLQKYSVSNDTVVVIHVNRKMRLDLSNINIPKLNISQLWILGTPAYDQSKCVIGGNLLESPTIFEFDYPA